MAVILMLAEEAFFVEFLHLKTKKFRKHTDQMTTSHTSPKNLLPAGWDWGAYSKGTIDQLGL